MFAILQMITGIQPDAPSGKLYVDPALPDWLPALTLQHLRVGEQAFDIHFWRDGEITRFKSLKGDAAAIVQRSCAVATERFV